MYKRFSTVTVLIDMSEASSEKQILYIHNYYISFVDTTINRYEECHHYQRKKNNKQITKK